MVSVNEKQVDLPRPDSCSVGAEFLNPNNAAVTAMTYDGLGKPSCGIERTKTTQVEWIDQGEYAIWRHALTELQSRCAFRNPNLDDVLSSLCPASESFIFCPRMLCHNRPKSQAAEDGVAKVPSPRKTIARCHLLLRGNEHDISHGLSLRTRISDTLACSGVDAGSDSVSH